MKQNQDIEQPDVPDKTPSPKMQPEEFGYKKFEAKDHRKKMMKINEARGKGDKESVIRRVYY